jgi:hypothetical protein
MSKLQKITDLREPPVVGRYYLVPCVRYYWHGMVESWPVIGPPHHDAEIGFMPIHYHIDARFLTRKQQRLAFEERTYSRGHKNFSIRQYNASPLSEIDQTNEWNVKRYGPIPRKPTLEKRICTNLKLHWPLPFKPGENEPMWLWFTDLAGAIERPDGRLLCPHKKVDLSQFEPDADGIVTCPLHGLRVRCRYPNAQSTLLGQPPAASDE